MGRPLTEDEATQADTLVADAELLIRERISDLDDQAEDDTYLAKVVMVESNAVARLLRNPEGHTAETDGNYSYQINWRLASGDLQITDKEWRLLGASSGISMLRLGVPTPFQRGPEGVHPFTYGG